MHAAADTPKLQSDFESNGYVAIRPLFSSAEMAALNTQIARYVRDIVPSMPASEVYYEDKSDTSSLI
mgnify:FL=1